MMDIRANKLLFKLAHRLAGHDISVGKLQELYEETITSLPANKIKLTEYLSKNSSALFKKFCGYFEQERDQQVAASVVENTVNSDLPKITFLQQILLSLKQPNKLTKLIDEQIQEYKTASSRKVPDILTQLCRIAIGLKSLIVLRCIGNSIYSFLENELKELIKKNTDISAYECLKDSILNVAVVLQNESKGYDVSSASKAVTESNLPQLVDILSALYSLYIDACLSLANLSANENDYLNTGNKIVEVGVVLLGMRSEKLLESLVQVSLLQSKNADVILLPLYKHVLLNFNWKNKHLTVPQYLQFILSVRQAMSVLQSNYNVLSKSIRNAGLVIFSPNTFYQWVVNRKGGEDLLDITPFHPTTKSLSITKCFIDEIDIETIEDFLDLCHADAIANIAPDDEETSLPGEDHDKQSGHTEVSYFVDTKPTTAVGYDFISNVEDMEVFSDEDEGSDALLKATEYLLDSDSDDELVWKKNSISAAERLKVSVTKCSQNVRPIEMNTSCDKNEDNSVSDFEVFKNSVEKLPSLVVCDANSPNKVSSTPSSDVKDRQKLKRSPATTRRTNIKRLRMQKNVKSCLSTIAEGHVQEESESKETKTKPVTSRKLRSDSESSTGSHGYMTRSRKFEL